MLSDALENQHIKIQQHECSADAVTVQTALEKFKKGYPTIVTHDVDILVLMIADEDRQACFSNEVTDWKSEKRRYFYPQLCSSSIKI